MPRAQAPSPRGRSSSGRASVWQTEGGGFEPRRLHVDVAKTAALFQRGSFTLASGAASDFKIECDALTDEDWRTLAYLLAQRLPVFGRVEGVPRGGLRLAEAMRPFQIPTSGNICVVDDVWTTGGSWHRFAEQIDAPTFGAVVFARGPLPDNVTALFQMASV